MRATIDSGGRVVVPKAVRERLNLLPGADVELTERDGWLEVAPAPTPMTLHTVGKAVVAHTDRDMPVLTTDQVRETIERGRR